MQFAL